MIKDVRDRETYFQNGKELIEWLNIDNEIAAECTLSIEDCKTEQDYCDFANEYELKLNDGMMVREFEVVE